VINIYMTSCFSDW